MDITERPTLELSGPRLTQSLETLIAGSEDDGGVEKYIEGIAFKASVFQETLRPDMIATLDEDRFLGLCAFMAPVRRRVAPWLAEAGIGAARDAIAQLLDNAQNYHSADARIATFTAAFPEGKKYRWVYDLAAELLHYTYPEHYPLMARWIWDRQANSGVLREIWHAENVDHITIEIDENYAMFLMLREEMTQFLASNGVFRDMLFYVDLLQAQIYADYICAQGGTFLRTDFASDHDPMQYTRRMLGLDGIDPDTGRTRVRRVDGQRYVLLDAALAG
jgi:hypothetical protein